MINLKKQLSILLGIILSITLIGCHSNKNDVKQKSNSIDTPYQQKQISYSQNKYISGPTINKYCSDDNYNAYLQNGNHEFESQCVFKSEKSSTPMYKKVEMTAASRGKVFNLTIRQDNLTKNVVTTTTGWSFQGTLSSDFIIKLLSGNINYKSDIAEQVDNSKTVSVGSTYNLTRTNPSGQAAMVLLQQIQRKKYDLKIKRYAPDKGKLWQINGPITMDIPFGNTQLEIVKATGDVYNKLVNGKLISEAELNTIVDTQVTR